MTIGEAVLAMRKHASLSQPRLAGLIGMSPSTLCLIEKGRRRPSAATLRKISAATGCRVWLQVDIPSAMARPTCVELPQ